MFKLKIDVSKVNEEEIPYIIDNTRVIRDKNVISKMVNSSPFYVEALVKDMPENPTVYVLELIDESNLHKFPITDVGIRIPESGERKFPQYFLDYLLELIKNQ